jgi:hypothetical protein
METGLPTSVSVVTETLVRVALAGDTLHEGEAVGALWGQLAGEALTTTPRFWSSNTERRRAHSHRAGAAASSASSLRILPDNVERAIVAALGRRGVTAKAVCPEQVASGSKSWDWVTYRLRRRAGVEALTSFIVNWELTRVTPGSSASLFI